MRLEKTFLGIFLFLEEGSLTGNGQRLRARHLLLEHLTQKRFLQSTEKQKILDLSETPRLKDFWMSVSHCPGAVAVSLGGGPHGVDVEKAARPTKETVSRVSSAVDIDLAPTPAHLWVAKESAFKALINDGDRLSLLSQISEVTWSESSDGSYDFQVKKPSFCVGKVWAAGAFVLAVALRQK